MPDTYPANALPADLKAVLFDLDGTLVDSLPGITETANRLLADHGRGPLAPEVVAKMVGDGAVLLVRRAFEATGTVPEDAILAAEAARYTDLLARAPIGPSDLYPGAVELIDALASRGCRIGVVTNKPTAPTAHALEELGLADRIQTTVCGDGPAGRKPEAGPILAALRTLEVDPAAAIMVGDNAADVGAARAAGIPVVVVSYGYTRQPALELGADAVVDSLTEVPGAIGRLWRTTVP